MFRIIALCCLLAACNPSTTVGELDGGAGADAGFDGGPPLSPYAQFCQSYATIYCSGVVKAQKLLPTDEAFCAQNILHSVCPHLASVERGYQRFDVAAGQACLQDLRSRMSSDLLSYSLCYEEVVQPEVELGKSCLFSADCRGEKTGCSGSGCARVCGPAGGLNQPCVDGTCNDGLWCDDDQMCKAPKAVGLACSHNSECEATAYCNLTTNKCAALPTDGQLCVSGRCAQSAFCDNTVCRTRAAPGASCTAFDGCTTGHFCNGGLCVAKLSAGANCTSGYACQDGLVCGSGGKCIVPSTEGGTCGNSFDCQPYSGLDCDPLLNTCLPYVSNRVVGQSCTGYQLNCQREFWCKDPAPGSGGICSLRDATAPCQDPQSCPAGMHCNAADGGAGSCVSSSTGSPCLIYGRNCPDTHYCHAPSSQTAGTCQPRAAEGQPCGDNGPYCQSPYRCSSTGVCGQLAKPGETCGQDVDCLWLHICHGGVCTPAGKVGQPCAGGRCLEGSCVGRDPSTGSLGTCQAPSPDGAVCAQATACSSSLCLNGTCLTCH